jgi:hypothetical protein
VTHPGSRLLRRITGGTGVRTMSAVHLAEDVDLTPIELPEVGF